jgi:NDP-sugar pyrophosphorylase family protein
MQAVILAAGEGTRMRPLTLERPKPLITIAGMPILEHVVRALPDEVSEIILVVNYMQDQIRAYCGEEFYGKKVIYVTQGEKKGTAGALEYARSYITGRFLLTFADDLLAKSDLEALVEHEHGLLVTTHKQPERFGVVSLTEDGSLKTITEKPEHPETNFISTGVTSLTPKIFEYHIAPAKNGEFQLTEGLTALASDVPVAVVKASYWQPVGYPEDIARAEASLQTFTVS